MSAPLVSVADLHERAAPQLDPVFEHPESEPAGGFMDQNEGFNFGRLRPRLEASPLLDEGFNFGRLRAAMESRREPSAAMANRPPPPPAALDEAFNFGRLRNAMRRRGNFDDL